MASLSSDPIRLKGKGKCRSERLAGCCGDGLRTRLCGRLVGWVRERAYLRTVLREMPRECATGSGLQHGAGPQTTGVLSSGKHAAREDESGHRYAR